MTDVTPLQSPKSAPAAPSARAAGSHFQVMDDLATRFGELHTAIRLLSDLIDTHVLLTGHPSVGWTMEQTNRAADVAKEALNAAWDTVVRMHRDAGDDAPPDAPRPAAAGATSEPPAVRGAAHDEDEVIRLAEEWHRASVAMRSTTGARLSELQGRAAELEGHLLRSASNTVPATRALLDVARKMAAEGRDEWIGDGPCAALIGRAMEQVEYLRNPADLR